MAYIPIATELSAKYTLTGPDGTVAVFNDSTDANYVGMIYELVGLDSPDVRESAADLVEADGGTHGAFYYSRRPISINVRLFGHASILQRNQRMDRARRASNAMRADAALSWTPQGGVPVFVLVRRQQPFRESGTWVKEIQIPLVSASAFINSVALHSVNAGVAAENQGSAPSFPVVNLTGPATNPTISDGTRTFRTMNMSAGADLQSGETMQVDMLNHTAKFTAGMRNGQSANRFIDFSNTTWPFLAAAGNTTFSVSAGTATILYRDAWI